MNFPFSEVLKQSWQTAWKTKLFWLFGIFTGGGFVFPGFSKKDWQETSAFFTSENFSGQVEKLSGMLLWLIVLFLIVGFIFAILSYLARAAFLRGIGQERAGATFRFGELVKFGWRKLWRLWGIDIILGLVNIPLLAVLIWTAIASGMPGQAEQGSAVATGFFAATIIVMVIYNIGIMLFKHYAHCFAILEDAKAWSAIKSGWRLFTKNAGVTVLTRLIEIGILIVTGLAMIIAMIVLIIPFVLIGVVLALLLGSAGAIVAVVLGSIVLILFALVARGLMNAFMYIYLTRVYWVLNSGKGNVDTVNNASGV